MGQRKASQRLMRVAQNETSTELGSAGVLWKLLTTPGLLRCLHLQSAPPAEDTRQSGIDQQAAKG